MKHRMLLLALLAGGLVMPGEATVAAEQPPVVPETALEKPGARKPAPKKEATAKSEAEGPSIKAGPATVIGKDVNVRGQAAINSEVVTKLNRGDRVTVLEQVVKKAKPDEPAKWARIALPKGTPVWVHASFIDENRAVKPRRLNLRSGPGENYSIVGRIERGTIVKEIETKGDWTKIEAPEGSYAFVAAHLLKNEEPAPVAVAARTPPPPPPVETTVVAPPPPVVAVEPQPVVPAPQPLPPTPQPAPAPVTPEPAPVAAAPTPTAPVGEVVRPPIAQPVLIEDPTVKRLVSREGIVRRSVSIQAPTYFVLENPINRRTMNYIHSGDTNIVLKTFEGKRILVTGEELLDERWPNTPVIAVETVEIMP